MTQKLLHRANFADLAEVNPSSITKACSRALSAACVGEKIDVNHPDAVAYLQKRVKATTPPPSEGLDKLHQEALAMCRKTGRYTASSLQRRLKIGYVRAGRILDGMRVLGLVPDEDTVEPEPEPVKTAYVRGHTAKNQKIRADALQSLSEAIAAKPVETVVVEETHEVPEHLEVFADMTLRELIKRYGTEDAFLGWLKASKELEAVIEKRLKNARTRGELISREIVSVHVIDVFDTAHRRIMSDGAKTIAAGAVAKHVSGSPLVEIEDYIADTLGSFLIPVKAKIKRSLKNVGS